MKKLLLRQHRILFRSVMTTLAAMLIFSEVKAQEEWSIAREWNEEMLFAITVDFGRPTIHARNLYHSSVVMYDAWAAYSPDHQPWLLGNTRGTFISPFNGVPIPDDPEALKAAREEAISYAMYRFILHRFAGAPGQSQILTRINNLMASKGYSPIENQSTNYLTDGPAALGNYIAAQMQLYGYTDGANEIGGYANQYYVPQNGIIYPQNPGNPELIDPNLWQPISVTGQFDQAGNPIFSTPGFLSAEWGEMVPFAMTEDDMTTKNRDGIDWKIYNDPGAPPLLDTTAATEWDDMYKWSFMMVSIWQSHMDPDDPTMWDISPGAKGNIPFYPESFEDFPDFYHLTDGGTIGSGRPLNPKTGMPYEPQLVKRGDYARVLAEFWADGPKSYTPPGHWYEIVNDAVLDHPEFERKWMGEGEELDDLEYDVKLYLTMGGSMYDAAVSCWSIKGYYDYIRPVSAIRYLCGKGQSSDPDLPSYHPAGAPLMDGYIELVEEGDPLAGENNEHVGKVKIYTWMGPDYITYADTVLLQHPSDYAGAGWILGENWWPWQRPKFVSPPFGGYISGHSTFSSTAAEVLERVTGDPFFPGGMGEFFAEQNEFFEFEVGPSTDITLQWATYRDASDQCSLSRIWGGIHPPIDDIKGRFLGMELGEGGVNFANSLFGADRPHITSITANQPVFNISDIGSTVTLSITYDREMDPNVIPVIEFPADDPIANSLEYISEGWSSEFVYEFTYTLEDGGEKLDDIFVRVKNARDMEGRLQTVGVEDRPLVIDTDRPEIASVSYNATMLNDDLAENSWLLMTIELDEESDTTSVPNITFNSGDDLDETLTYIQENSGWLDEFNFQATFDLVDFNQEISAIGISIDELRDKSGNGQEAYDAIEQFDIDTRNPEFVDPGNNTVLNIQSIGNNALEITLVFDEDMNTEIDPSFGFTSDDPMGVSLLWNSVSSGWLPDGQTYMMNFNLTSNPVEFSNIDVVLQDFYDLAGNVPAVIELDDLFTIDTQRPGIASMTPSVTVISDSEVGNGVFEVVVQYDEAMLQTQSPVVSLSAADDISGSVQFAPFDSDWIDDFTFAATFNVFDENIEVEDISVEVEFGKDAANNDQEPYEVLEWINLDTRNPEVTLLTANTYLVTSNNIGTEGFTLFALFDETMSQEDAPEIEFGPMDVSSILSVNNGASGWLNNTMYQMAYDVANQEFLAEDIAVTISQSRDLAGNLIEPGSIENYFDININSVGIAENDQLGLTFYPNPLSSGQTLLFNVGKALHDAELRIVSSSGQMVHQQLFKQLPVGIQEVHLNNYTAGMYFVQIQSAEGTQSQKLIVIE